MNTQPNMTLIFSELKIEQIVNWRRVGPQSSAEKILEGAALHSPVSFFGNGDASVINLRVMCHTTDSLHHTDFKTLRLAYLEVKSFIENESGDEITSLDTKIENDLGLAGDDNWELLEKFVTKYKLNTTGFDYSKHFLSEGELFNSGTALISLLMIPVIILRWFIKLITFGKYDFTDKQLFPNAERKTLDMTFGDMLVWYLTGTYNLRGNIKVTLKNGP